MEDRVISFKLSRVADVVIAKSEIIMGIYEDKLSEMQSPLVSEEATREQVRLQTRSVLREVAESLSGQGEPLRAARERNGLSQDIGASRARGGIHVSESLRAATALYQAVLSVVISELPQSRASTYEVAAVAVELQSAILERVARASVSYVDYLLVKLLRSHTDERQRISRELHDRTAHMMVAIFRELELLEMYTLQENRSKARAKLEGAKEIAQEALKSIRDLSRELRSPSVEVGLEVALSEYLRMATPPGVRAWVSAEGDEANVGSEILNEVFLILREAVRNALNHSGASSVRVGFVISRDSLKAAVEDDGRGFEAERVAAFTSGTGLLSMTERAQLLGGSLDMVSAPGGGTKVSVTVPLPRSAR